VMERDGLAGQMTRMAEGFGYYDPKRLDMAAPVYASLTDWVRAQDGGDVPTVVVDGEVIEFEHCGVVGPDCEDPAGFSGGGGVYENDETPTCNPIDDVCSYCGRTMCAACSAERDGEAICVECVNEEEQ
jgi:hypothetical protein